MAMVNSGPISLGGNATSGGLNQSVNIELGRSATASINMNESAVRTLAGVASGAISMSNFYGKSNEFSFTIASDTQNANLRTLAINAGWNQSSTLRCTINSGIVVSANSTGVYALTISGSFPGGVNLINNGFIIGMGGGGGSGSYTGSGGGGGSAGPALLVQSAVSITNNGTIGGGGGGGGGGGTGRDFVAAGSGGGGGRTGRTNSAGGSGAFGFNFNGANGSGGTFSSAGGGGGGVYGCAEVCSSGGAGGNGGGWGSSGNSGGGGDFPSGGGSGGSGGAAVVGNSNITWIATGTRLGSIS